MKGSVATRVRPALAAGHTSSLQSLKELLPSVVRGAQARRRTRAILQRRWDRAVGRRIARHTRVSSFRRGVLYVATNDSGANFLLSLQKPRVLKQLRRMRTYMVDEIVIRAGEIAP